MLKLEHYKMDSTEKEVQALINTLGFLEKGVYYPEPDCFQNIRDLIRHMHRDDRLLTVRRLCNGHNIVKNDLVPIMNMEMANDELFDAALRLTVNLCQPTLMIFDNKRPEDPAEWQIFYELETSLVRTIVAFNDVKIFKKFAEKIRHFFDTDWEDRTEKQRILIERIFVLIRYIFGIGVESIKHFSVPEIDNLTRERVIAQFFSSGIDEIFHKLAGNSSEREFCGYIVVILALIFRTLDSKAIAHEGEADLQRKDREELEAEQAKVVEAIKIEECNNRRKIARRNFLSGTLVAKGVKALNPEKEFVLKSSSVITNESGSSPIELLAKRKKQRVPPRNRRVDNLEVAPEQCTKGLQELQPDAMLTIKQFCTRLLLEGRYNRLMRTTKDMSFGNHRQQLLKVTELHFLSLASFMVAFARHCHFSYQHITVTFSVEFFHQITAYLTDCFDKMKTDRQNIRKYALSAQYAVTAFKEIVIMLNAISASIHAEEKEFLHEFCHQIFQMEEYRELAAGILLHLSPAGTSHKMLQDLLLANHYFLFLMEKSVREGELRKIQKKKRQQKRKKAQKQKHKEQVKSIENTVKLKGLHILWQEISEELADTIAGKINPNEEASPLNILIKADDEQLEQFARLQIQLAMRTRRIADAVGIYRNARVLWPENGTFGSDSTTPDEELTALDEVFRADMREVSKQYTEAIQQAYGRGADWEEEKEEKMVKNNDDDEKQKDEGDEENKEAKKEVMNEEEDDDAENNDELKDDQAASGYRMVESDFDFNGFISSLAKPAVINWYIFSLRQFRTNPKEVNQAIVKFFHRIAFDLKSPARLYLATLFRVFKEINAEVGRVSSDLRSQHPHFKLYEFGYYLLRKFFVHFQQRGPGVMACELLFSKTAREAYEIEEGYGAME